MSLTLYTNLTVNATSQFTDYDFNSYCQFGDALLCCSSSMLGRMVGMGNVDSLFETFATNLGWPGNKRNRYIYLGIETEGTIIVTPMIDRNPGTPITFTPNTLGRQYMKMTVPRDNVGGLWGYKVENVDGCWFSINEISVLPTYLSKTKKA